MSRFISFLAFHKKGVIFALLLFVVGAFFRWEVSEIVDARTGQQLASHHRVVAPWQGCGANGGGRLVNFHVRHWLCYGLVKLEASGQTM